MGNKVDLISGAKLKGEGLEGAHTHKHTHTHAHLLNPTHPMNSSFTPANSPIVPFKDRAS